MVERDQPLVSEGEEELGDEERVAGGLLVHQSLGAQRRRPRRRTGTLSRAVPRVHSSKPALFGVREGRESHSRLMRPPALLTKRAFSAETLRGGSRGAAHRGAKLNPSGCQQTWQFCWRLQAVVEGDLSEPARSRAHQIARVAIRRRGAAGTDVDAGSRKSLFRTAQPRKLCVEEGDGFGGGFARRRG
jgi:hypothetical protein